MSRTRDRRRQQDRKRARRERKKARALVAPAKKKPLTTDEKLARGAYAIEAATAASTLVEAATQATASADVPIARLAALLARPPTRRGPWQRIRSALSRKRTLARSIAEFNALAAQVEGQESRPAGSSWWRRLRRKQRRPGSAGVALSALHQVVEEWRAGVARWRLAVATTERRLEVVRRTGSTISGLAEWLEAKRSAEVQLCAYLNEQRAKLERAISVAADRIRVKPNDDDLAWQLASLTLLARKALAEGDAMFADE